MDIKKLLQPNKFLIKYVNTPILIFQGEHWNEKNTSILPAEYSVAAQNNQQSCRHRLQQVPLCAQHNESPLDAEQWTLI